ncbi:MAG TPA: glycoside hydrolase [Armatimonadota bacterium]|nr:glycoside hydrolase [Armatimonadota bacterium]
MPKPLNAGHRIPSTILKLLAATALAFLTTSHALSAPATRQAGGSWILENATLRVEIDPPAGRFQVLDKRARFTWRGPDGDASQATRILLPKVTTPPKIDGDLSEWAHIGTPLTIPEGKEGADPGARLRAAWGPAGLYLAVAVKDRRFVTCAPDETRWWEKDSVEFWIHETQYAVRFGTWGANIWAASGDVRDASVDFAETADGYTVEVLMPARLLGAAKSPGGLFRLAVGVNDADDANGRKAQIYFPASWQHSNSETFAIAVLGDEKGEMPPVAGDAKPVLTPVYGKQAPGTASFTGSVRTKGQEVPVTTTFALLGDTPELRITLAPADPAAPVDKMRVLHPLVLDDPEGRVLATPYNGGIGIPTDDLSWRGREWRLSGMLDMPWVGLTDGTKGYLLLWELPRSCDDGLARLEGVLVGGKTLLAPAAWHAGTKGTFAYPRVIRYIFIPGGGHVAMCKRFREYAREHGILKTLREKMKRKPQLARLAGAPDVWGRSDLKFCREAKAAGIDRLLVNGTQPKADTEAIKALGYLAGRYDNYEDAYEGDPGHMGDFKTETDGLVLANGERMKAWLTHGTPPKQFMKRCTALFEKVARTWIPRELEAHPMNARFLDVTTACGLAECYSDHHPLNRTEDRLARRRLAQYVGNELGLVLGGEHGRWWAADLYDYWEGMQSGGFYSWPAGYVGEKIPATREEIGQRYLEWGLGERYRYPLWELVFHDCVVSTWYWGDSTGHLIQAAPELGYKKDAFNILYGTIPLYWVNKPYSYRWDQPETRARLLESYRNTCKLHEQIAFEEMVSHAFVTPDRAVQTTRFADGTQVWVNFGEKPWTLKRDGKEWTLPQYGFYVKGPRIEQYRIVKGDAPNGTITCIRTPDYLYAEGNVPGAVETAEGTGVTIRRDGPDRLRIIPEQATRWVRLNPSALFAASAEKKAAASPGQWRIVQLDEEGNALRVTGAARARGEMLELASETAVRPTLLLGPRALAGVPEVVFAEASATDIPVVKQGQPATLQFRLANHGGKSVKGVPVAAYLDRIAPGNRVEIRRVDVPAGQSATVTFSLSTGHRDGWTRFHFEVGNERTVTYCKPAAVTERVVFIEPDWTQWDTHVDLRVEMGPVSRRNPVVELPFDPAAERAKQGRSGPVDLTAVRVTRVDVTDPRQALCEAQVITTLEGEKRLAFRVPGTFEAGAVITCRVYLDALDHEHHAKRPIGHWNAAETAYDSPRYRVRFIEGYIRGVELKQPAVTLLSSLGVSSADTGWVNESGEVESFEVLQDGPLLTQVRVKKNLAKNHSYDKLYSFYPDYFVVTTLSPERFGTMSRAYYQAKCRYQDDKGNQAEIDGRGDAEGIAGKNPNPQWYATWGEGWGLSGIPITPHENVNYWDAGNMAGLGFNTTSKSPATVAYVLHGADEPNLKAPDFGALDRARLMTPVVVRR